MLIFKAFTNRPIDSVCYVFHKENNDRCIIVDAGTENHSELFTYLRENELVPEVLLLTHEHFDHILGINDLMAKFPQLMVASSQKTSDRLPLPKKNLSVFYNQQELVVQNSNIILLEEEYTFADIQFEVLETPGHTDSSIGFIINDYFLTGDFFLEDLKTVTNLPTGSRHSQKESLEKHKQILQEKIILPGHGKPFRLN